MNREILSLVEKFCGSKTIDQLLLVNKKAQTLEQEVLKNYPRTARSKKTQQGTPSPIALEQILAVCKQSVDGYDYEQILLGIGTIYKSHGKFDSAETTFDLAIEYGKRLKSQDYYIAEALYRRGEVYARLALWQKSETDLTASKLLFQKLNNDVAVAKIDNILAANYAEQGDVKKAEEWFLKALQRFESTDQRIETGMVLLNLGITQNILGNHDEALNYYRRVVPYFQEAGDLIRLAELRHNIAMSYNSKGDHLEALREFDKSLAHSRKAENPSLMGLALLGKADAYYRLDDTSLALVFANQALNQFTGLSDNAGIAEVYKIKGMIFRDRSRYDVAESFFLTSVHMNEELSNHLNIGETYFEWGMMEKSRKKKTLAKDYLKRALAAFTKVGASNEIARTKEELSGIRG